MNIGPARGHQTEHIHRTKENALKLTVTTFTTLDGIAQAPGGADEDRDGGFEYGGWVSPHIDDDFGQAMAARFDEADAFLLGRKTYEIFAAYWPQVTDESDPIAGRLNALPKYVASRTLDRVDWEHSTLLEGDAADAVQKLKDEPGRELQVHGSLNLIQTLVKADLVDTYQVLVFPLVLGSGKRLFDDIVPTGLELTDSSATSTGVMVQIYRPTGRPTFQDVPGLE
jgi:dihydrofolate reductase